MAAPSANSDMSSDLSSIDIMDTEEDDPPRKKRQRKKKKLPVCYSDSDSSGPMTHPTNVYKHIHEADDTLVLWNYQHEISAFRRNKQGAENPFYVVNPMENFCNIPPIKPDNPIFHLPDEIMQSVKYRGACYLIKEDLSTLRLRPVFNQWELEKPQENKSIDEVKSELGLDGENTYTEDMHFLLTQRLQFYDGFIGKLKNSVGRRCLDNLLNLALYVIWRASDHQTFTSENVGGGAPRDGNARIFETDFVEKGFRWNLEKTPVGEDVLSKLFDMTKDEACFLSTRVPDAQVYVKERGSERKFFIITGEVNSELPHAYLEKALEQAWKQALVGLIHMDVTYGLLLCRMSACLLEIKLDNERKAVATARQHFDFQNPNGSFNTDNFLNLFKCVVGVLYQYRSSS